ncbi:T9SS type A sorting domain-containing protein [Desulfosarcina sp.]|nr:T9SS type A sorting domain-containing protein [Desulfosarcina sp.]
MCNNPALASLAGLESLNYIGGEFWIQNNEQLEEISSLSSLNTVGEITGIIYNSSLCCLSGLDNINPESIFNLTIHNNPVITTCAIESICAYLVNPAGNIEIYDNASGCNSQLEVEEACNVIPSVEYQLFKNEISISPNPCSGLVILRYVMYDVGGMELDIIDIAGMRMKSISIEEKIPGTYEMEIDLSDIPDGIYFCVLKTNLPAGGQTIKMIKL